MNSLLASDAPDSVLVTGSATYKPAGCRRYTGATLPPHGIPTPTASLENINERLERLAFGPRPGGGITPPLETYTVASGPYGDVVSATDEYRRWFQSRYPNARGGDPVQRGVPSTAPEGVGRNEVTF